MAHDPSARRAQHKTKPGGKFFPAFCNILGVLLILAVIAVALPLSLPRFLGYEIYEVVSGSMEPEIPIGSVIYVAAAPPEELQVGEIITFMREGEAVTHRVVRNRLLEGELVTKGDANPVEDIDPVPYAAVIGRVERHYPMLGHMMTIYSSTMGRVYLLMVAVCGVLFQVLAGRLREHRRAALEAAGIAESDSRSSRAARRGRTARRIVMALLLAVFLFSAGNVIYVQHGYKVNEEIYSSAADRFTQQAAEDSVPAGEAGNAPVSGGEQTAADTPRIREGAPIIVDFDSLRSVNSDVIGWIYCAGTVIDYPVAHGNNDYYLHHSYDGTYSSFGTIFVEETNSPDFSDASSILYGHHMRSGAMFATLEEWGDQSYYEEHPVMYLLTPERDYRIVLVSGYAVSAYSDTYTIFPENNDEFRAYMEKALARSEFQSGAEFDENGHYVMLSTCAYMFDNARYVLHGLLVPLDTAGGKWIE